MLSFLQNSSNERTRALTWTMLALVFVSAGITSVFIGQSSWTDELWTSLFTLRIWRVVVAFGLGASLAISGVVIQAIFQNPLAGPSIIGTNAGAALGGQLMIMFTHGGLLAGAFHYVEPEFLVPIGAFIGAWASLVLLLAIIGRRADSVVALLVGFLLSSVFASFGAFIVSISQESWQLGRAILSFSMGSIAGAGPRQAALITMVLLIGLLGTFSWHRHLDLMLTGDDEAKSMGMDVAQVRRWGVIWTSILCAGAVAVGGNIAFVGLITPHILRPLVGHSARHLIPASAFAGGVFVILCDIVARYSAQHGETPLGIITGLIGAPIFLYLLLRTQREGGLRG